MRKSCLTKPKIMTVLRQADSGVAFLNFAERMVSARRASTNGGRSMAAWMRRRTRMGAETNQNQQPRMDTFIQRRSFRLGSCGWQNCETDGNPRKMSWQ